MVIWSATKTSSVEIHLLSGFIAQKKIITGLDAIIIVPYISLCLCLGWCYNYSAIINQDRYIMTDLSTYFHVILFSSSIPVLSLSRQTFTKLLRSNMLLMCM